MAYPISDDIVIYAGDTFSWSYSPVIDCAPAPVFTVSTPYQVGDFLTDAAGNVYMVVTAGTAAASIPTWNTTIGDVTTSNTAKFMRVGSERLLDTSAFASARFKVRAEPGGTVLASGSNADGRVEIGWSPPVRANSTAYSVGFWVVPAVPNGWVYVCETAGTSAVGTPAQSSWTTTPGATVTDESVVWRCLVSDENVLTNVRISLPSSYTATLSGWASAPWSLELGDGFNIYPIAGGNARLVFKMAQV